MNNFSLIPVYAGRGDTLLVRTPIPNQGPNQDVGFWLIDGGPLTLTARENVVEGDVPNHPYYQFLQAALRHYCSDHNQMITKLRGIVVTHIDNDHMQGIIRIINDWLYDPNTGPTVNKPLAFDGPIVFTETFLESTRYVHDTNLSQALSNVNFRVFDQDDCIQRQQNFHDPIIPPGMINKSEAQVCVMIRPSGRWQNILQPLPVLGIQVPAPPVTVNRDYTLIAKTIKPEKFSPDPSKTNKLSISTTFAHPVGAALDLLTTGDGVARVIQSMLSLNGDTTVNIFKVPHHGSKFNNLVYVPEEAALKEGHLGDFFFIGLMLSVRYDQYDPQVGPDYGKGARDNETDAAAAAILAAGKRRYFREWRKHCRKEKAVVPDDADFDTLLGLLQRATSFNWEFGVSAVKKTQLKIAFSGTAKAGTPKALELYNPPYSSETKDLIQLIWARLTAEERWFTTGTKPTEMGTDAKCGGAEVVFKPELKANTVFNTFLKYKWSGFDGKIGIWVGSTPAPSWTAENTWQEVFKMSFMDQLWRARKIQQFYDKFSALNYVISANGIYEHPNPETIAGIISSALHRNDQIVRRIFVTTGYALMMDVIAELVEKLIVDNPAIIYQQPSSWQNCIKIFCFYEQPVAEIPIDNSPVEGCVEIPFPPNDDQEQQLWYLDNVFNKPLPSNIPRARASWNSSFNISLVDNQGNTISHLDLKDDGQLIHRSPQTPEAPAEFALLVRDAGQAVNTDIDRVFVYDLRKRLPADANAGAQLRDMTTPASLAVWYLETGSTATAGTCRVFDPDGNALVKPTTNVLNGFVVADVDAEFPAISTEIAHVKFTRVNNL